MRFYLLLGLVVAFGGATPWSVVASEPVADEAARTPSFEELLRTADHLEAAGRTEQARCTRILARNEQQKARLAIGPAQPADMRQVLIRAQILEVSRTKLRVLGFDLGRKIEAADASGENEPRYESTSIASFLTSPDGSPATTSSIRPFLDALMSDQLAKVLSAPELVVTTGRPATMRMGREIPTRIILRNGERTIEMDSLGTEVRCTAVVLDNGAIHLDYHHAVRSLSGKDSDETSLPQYIGCTEFDTEMVLHPGQTGTVSQSYTRLESIRRKNNEVQQQKNEIELLLLVTAELVEPKEAANDQVTTPR